MRRLIYAAPADLTLAAAHNVHIVRMCEALGDIGGLTSLIVRDAPGWEKLAAEYDLASEFPLERVGPTAGRFRSSRFAREVLRRTRRGDRVVTRNLPTACLLASLGRRVVLELHSPPTTLRARAMLEVLTRSAGFVGLVVVTQALETHFRALLGKSLSGRIHVLPDAAVPRSDSQGDLGLRRPAVGYVGSFLPGKGAEMIPALAALLPQVQFYLVGGPEGDEGTAERQDGANLTYVGRLPHAGAMTWIDAFDVVLLPNQNRVIVSDGAVDIGPWTSPLKLFEYMAAGKAIVASRLDVLQEVLVEGRNCLLADPGDTRDWAEKIAALIADPSRAAALGRQARADFLNDYTWRRRAERMLKIFDDAHTD